MSSRNAAGGVVFQQGDSLDVVNFGGFSPNSGNRHVRPASVSVQQPTALMPVYFDSVGGCQSLGEKAASSFVEIFNKRIELVT